MRRLTFWILPGLVALLLLAVLVGDLLRDRPRAEPREVAVDISGRLGFLAAEPVFELRRGDGPDPPWTGLVLGRGWARPGLDGTWVVGDSAELWFHAAEAGLDTLVLDARPFPGLGARQAVSLTLNGSELGSFELRRGWQRLRAALPPGVVSAPDMNHLRLRFRHHRSPADAGTGNDDRSLAASVRRLALVGVGREIAASLPEVVENGSAVLIPRSGELLLPLISEGPTTMAGLGYGFPAGAGAGGRRLELRLLALMDGALVELDRRQVDEGEGRHGRVRLQAGGQTGPFLLSARLSASEPGSGAVLRRPILHLPPPRRMKPEDLAPPPPPRTETAPDVVLVVLDAARTDRFGLAGYHRDTTPEIDRIARTSLVFPTVRAEAPYTQCSMASMLTGRPWTAHGAVRPGRAVAEGVTTLAEHLGDLGYHTVGLSASPWNSVGAGLARGYSEFVQVWEGRSVEEAVDAAVIADLVERRVATGTPDRPLFLMVHLIPPHEPYTPATEHDLFTEPDYPGPCDGSMEYLAAIDAEAEPPPPADVRRMSDLYDGNLRAADAAVGRIAASLVRHRRPDQTLLVITSDHGEAFYEHGHRGHNTTLYEEMLRVPLVVRLPGGRRPEGLDLSTPATLLDLAPTILRAVGAAVPDGMVGRDLLAPTSATAPVLLRTAPGPEVLGLQLGRLKAVVAPPGGRRRELYDLASDPHERTNLALERPREMVLLTHLVDTAAATAVEGGDQPLLTPADTEMLHQLGYLEQ